MTILTLHDVYIFVFSMISHSSIGDPHRVAFRHSVHSGILVEFVQHDDILSFMRLRSCNMIIQLYEYLRSSIHDIGLKQ
ncbi:hypothetical protein BLOT_000769 [Blomia tropicalis]|nr:hypothetical protein BLOT_000769 [Blomia tropicalis]